jgi:hypothetical protein
MARATPPAAAMAIDTHGMIAALTTKQNSVRVAVIDAIESGTMMVLKPVSDEMKKLRPDLWDDFKDIKNKKYLHVSVKAVLAATMLSEQYGASILGSIPSGEHFEAVAAARTHGCKLVSSGKALGHCTDIAKKCGLPPDSVVAITSV